MNESAMIVVDSFARCTEKGLLDRFYQIFLKSDPRVAQKFAHTDFERQKDLLKHSIHLAILYADGKIAGKTGLDRIRETHSHAHLDISPALYSLWKESFLKAVSELDPRHSPKCHEAWDQVLQKAIDHLVSGYTAYD